MFRSLIKLIVVVVAAVAAVATIAEESQSDPTAAEIYGRRQSLCVCQSHVVLLLQMSMSCSEQITCGKPIILLIGHIVIAHKEWSSLGTIAQLRVSPRHRHHDTLIIPMRVCIVADQPDDSKSMGELGSNSCKSSKAVSTMAWWLYREPLTQRKSVLSSYARLRY